MWNVLGGFLEFDMPVGTGSFGLIIHYLLHTRIFIFRSIISYNSKLQLLQNKLNLYI